MSYWYSNRYYQYQWYYLPETKRLNHTYGYELKDGVSSTISTSCTTVGYVKSSFLPCCNFCNADWFLGSRFEVLGFVFQTRRSLRGCMFGQTQELD